MTHKATLVAIYLASFTAQAVGVGLAVAEGLAARKRWRAYRDDLADERSQPMHPADAIYQERHVQTRRGWERSHTALVHLLEFSGWRTWGAVGLLSLGLMLGVLADLLAVAWA